MGNTIKLVSGFILFVIGVLIAYETNAYNLIDVLLIVGFIIAIVGIILIISYFVDTNADRTSNMLKDFIESREGAASSLRGGRKSSSEGPLKVRRNTAYDDEYDNYDDGFGELGYEEDYPEYGDNSRQVLNRPPQREYDESEERELTFTPNYNKPMKVTRSPKRRQNEYYEEEIPEFVVEPTNNAGEIQEALAQEEEPIAPVIDTQREVEPEVAASREIKIDVNDPESLPVPKSLNSYVISDGGVLTSQEAFDNLAVNVTKEIMLEIPSLNDLSDRFLSHVPTIYSRVIINEFDVSDMSYMFLISSLIKQGVHIRTVPKVHSINLITDDSHAMIISEGKGQMEYGAIYSDRNSISNIRADFERTWNIASNLDESILASATGGV